MAKKMSEYEKGAELYDYLTYNFYPPIREEVKQSWVRMFTKYWRGEITYRELVDTCPLNRDEFLARFSEFLSFGVAFDAELEKLEMME